MNHRKNSITSLLSAALLGIAVCAMSLSSDAANQTTFSGTGTVVSNANDNVSYYVVSAAGDAFGQGIPRIEYLNVTSDKAAGVLQFYTVTAVIPITGTSTNTSTNVTAALPAWPTYNSTNTVCLIRANPQDTYQRLTIFTNTATTVSFREGITGTIDNTDTLYILTKDANIPVGAATKEVTMVGAYNGVQGYPLLLEVSGNTNRAINCVSGRFTAKVTGPQ